MSRPCGFGTVTTTSPRTMNWCRPPEKGPSNPSARKPRMSFRRGTGPQRGHQLACLTRTTAFPREGTLRPRATRTRTHSSTTSAS
jgi:hypothetical protein